MRMSTFPLDLFQLLRMLTWIRIGVGSAKQKKFNSLALNNDHRSNDTRTREKATTTTAEIYVKFIDFETL